MGKLKITKKTSAPKASIPETAPPETPYSNPNMPVSDPTLVSTPVGFSQNSLYSNNYPSDTLPYNSTISSYTQENLNPTLYPGSQSTSFYIPSLDPNYPSTDSNYYSSGMYAGTENPYFYPSNADPDINPAETTSSPYYSTPNTDPNVLSTENPSSPEHFSSNPNPDFIENSPNPECYASNIDTNYSGACSSEPVVTTTPEFDFESAKEQFLLNLPCTECGNTQIDLFLPGCRHPYHISCFNQHCKVCETEVIIPRIQKTHFCEFCQIDQNLLICPDCNTTICFLCVFYKTTSKCCQLLLGQLEKTFTFCPGCEFLLDYSEFVPVKCRNHSLLCKKCLFLGSMNGKCVMGCEVLRKVNQVVKCQACEVEDFEYFGNFKCKECVVCERCQWKVNLKASESGYYVCVLCENPLRAMFVDS